MLQAVVACVRLFFEADFRSFSNSTFDCLTVNLIYYSFSYYAPLWDAIHIMLIIALHV